MKRMYGTGSIYQTSNGRWVIEFPCKGKRIKRRCATREDAERIRQELLAQFPPKPLVDRFWEKVQKSDGCWEWTAGRFSFGYGSFRNDKNQKTHAHRFSWELHYGPIPDGLMVLHRCDNPPCVRPDHLFLGTMADNIRDMYDKGRDIHTKEHAQWWQELEDDLRRIHQKRK